MKTRFLIDVRPKHLSDSTRLSRSRRPAMEILEGRALSSAGHAMLDNRPESLLAAARSSQLVRNSEVSLGALTYPQKQASRNASPAIGIGGGGHQACVRHAVAYNPKIVEPHIRGAAALDDDPPPAPEPAPPVNPINGPVQYPTLPPSGPLGPG